MNPEQSKPRDDEKISRRALLGVAGASATVGALGLVRNLMTEEPSKAVNAAKERAELSKEELLKEYIDALSNQNKIEKSTIKPAVEELYKSEKAGSVTFETRDGRRYEITKQQGFDAPDIKLLDRKVKI